MNNPLRILLSLESKLTHNLDLILYGKAAIALGFPTPPDSSETTKDVDAIIPMAELLAFTENTGFWDALDNVNDELKKDGLYMTHLFQEDQVILSPDWHSKIVPIRLGFKQLRLHRPSTLDLVLTKMMRGDDPLDMEDVRFLLKSENIPVEDLKRAFGTARVPDLIELRDAFDQAQPRVLEIARELEADRIQKPPPRVRSPQNPGTTDMPRL